MSPKRILFFFICLLLLASCTLQAPTSAPTSTSSHTVVPATLPSGPTIPPTAPLPTVVLPTATLPPTVVPPTAVPPTKVPPTAVPPTKVTPTKVPPTVAPTLKPTQAPTATKTTGMPQVPEAILILSPGVNSSIVSPIKISGEADPTFEQSLIAKVVGDNGLSVGMKSTTIQADAGLRGPFSVDVAFQVTRAQSGRVAVWSTSAKDGGLIHFSSIDVNLLTSGSAKINAGQALFEPLLITKPASGDSASGGKLHLEGWSAPVYENTLSVVLCGEGGNGKSDPFCGTVDNVLARMTVQVKAPDVGQPGTFSLDITYKVTTPVNGRVAVYYTSPRDGGLLHLTSVPVTLKP